MITRNVRFDFVRYGRREVLISFNNDGAEMADTGIWGADRGVGSGVVLRDCRRAMAVAVDRLGRDWAGLGVRVVGVIGVRDEERPCGRGVSGTAVCVEVEEVDVMEGVGDGARPLGGFGVGVRLEEGEI
jgi:hypothetical protein